MLRPYAGDATMKDWPLGATTRPWHAFPLAEACDAIAAAGYTQVALYANEGKMALTADSSAADIEAVQGVLAARGLVATMLLGGPSLSGEVEAAVEQYRRLVDVAAAAGIRFLMNGGTENPATYDRYITISRRVAPYAHEKGVELQLKPHGGIGLTGKDLRRVAEQVANPAFSICYDPGNIIYYTKGQTRPEPDVGGVAALVRTCIIKDCVVADGKPDVWIQPGSGWVAFDAVLGGLAAAGFDGPLYVECLGGSELADINRRARETYDWLRALLVRL
jgi:sugar phosphate isomerase/epimerase